MAKSRADIEQKVSNEAGADVDQADQYGFTPLLKAWSDGNQEAANQLILLGANIDENEHLFNAHLLADDGFGWVGCEAVSQQIALSKQHAVYLERARQLGLSIGDVCFQFMEYDKRIGREIGKFLFDGVGTTAFNTGCEMAFQALSKQFPAPAPKKLLPIPRSLSFMPYFSSLMSQASSGSRLLPENVVSDLRLWQQQAGYQTDWQRWQETYHDKDEMCPLRKQPGYGPGAMVVYKPKS